MCWKSKEPTLKAFNCQDWAGKKKQEILYSADALLILLERICTHKRQRNVHVGLKCPHADPIYFPQSPQSRNLFHFHPKETSEHESSTVRPSLHRYLWRADLHGFIFADFLSQPPSFLCCFIGSVSCRGQSSQWKEPPEKPVRSDILDSGIVHACIQSCSSWGKVILPIILETPSFHDMDVSISKLGSFHACINYDDFQELSYWWQNCRRGKLALIFQHKLYKKKWGSFFSQYMDMFYDVTSWWTFSGGWVSPGPKVWSSPKVSKRYTPGATKLVQKHQSHQERQKWLLYVALRSLSC